MTSPAYYVPYRPENLPPGIDLWQIYLDSPDALAEELTTILSPDEILRANRYSREIIRNRFIVGRGAMRCILSLYTDAAPGTLAFKYGPAGKPYLEPLSKADISFNLSHSGSLALLAVTDGKAVGIDLEEIHPVNEMDRLVTDYFSSREKNAFFALSLFEKESAFFRIWTRKEAYIKARGDGLGFPIDRFSVSFLPHDLPRLIEVELDPQGAEGWRMFHLDPREGYIGALVIER